MHLVAEMNAAAIAGLIACGAVVAAVIYITVTGQRPCPQCGRRVKAGQLDCPWCGYDFRTVSGQDQPAGPAQHAPMGWYSDPLGTHKERRWDGSRWTDEVRD
jgi:hypothetical protein